MGTAAAGALPVAIPLSFILVAARRRAARVAADCAAGGASAAGRLRMATALPKVWLPEAPPPWPFMALAVTPMGVCRGIVGGAAAAEGPASCWTPYSIAKRIVGEMSAHS